MAGGEKRVCKRPLGKEGPAVQKATHGPVSKQSGRVNGRFTCRNRCQDQKNDETQVCFQGRKIEDPWASVVGVPVRSGGSGGDGDPRGRHSTSPRTWCHQVTASHSGPGGRSPTWSREGRSSPRPADVSFGRLCHLGGEQAAHAQSWVT